MFVVYFDYAGVTQKMDMKFDTVKMHKFAYRGRCIFKQTNEIKLLNHKRNQPNLV